MASILVVDQDAGSREFIREILSDYGYVVLAAVSVADAAEHWTHHRIDLALLDARTVELGSSNGGSRASTSRSGCRRCSTRCTGCSPPRRIPGRATPRLGHRVRRRRGCRAHWCCSIFRCVPHARRSSGSISSISSRPCTGRSPASRSRPVSSAPISTASYGSSGCAVAVPVRTRGHRRKSWSRRTGVRPAEPRTPVPNTSGGSRSR